MKAKLLLFLFLFSFGGKLHSQDTFGGLSKNDTLTSSIYTIVINDSVGTISGFPYGTLLKDVVAGVALPFNCTFNIINGSNEHQPLKILNWDTLYVDVQVSENIYLKVTAENGINKIVYQLKPSNSFDEVFVISDFYTVDQTDLRIDRILDNTSVDSLFKYLTPVPGATMMVIDNYNSERIQGFVALDDKLVVRSQNGRVSKIYYFQDLNCCSCRSNLLYVVSDEYFVDQIPRFIYNNFLNNTLVGDFLATLSAPSYARIKIVNAHGIENTGALASGDRVELTIDGQDCKAYYHILTKLNCFATSSVYVFSDVYAVDQTNLTIDCHFNLNDSILVSDFLAHLFLSEGASVRVVNDQGIEKTGVLAIGDKVVVHGANYVGKVVYKIINLFDAVNTIENSSITIYPNPTSGNFNISGIPAGSKIAIRSILGQNLFETFNSFDNLQFSLEDQPAGIYFILINNDTGVACFKLIVQ
jgi:hypothetical protein